MPGILKLAPSGASPVKHLVSIRTMVERQLLPERHGAELFDEAALTSKFGRSSTEPQLGVGHKVETDLDIALVSEGRVRLIKGLQVGQVANQTDDGGGIDVDGQLGPNVGGHVHVGARLAVSEEVPDKGFPDAVADEVVVEIDFFLLVDPVHGPKGEPSLVEEVFLMFGSGALLDAPSVLQVALP